MAEGFRGATNEYLADYLRTKLEVSVEAVEGNLPERLACPVCQYKTFVELGTWKTCPVCGWNSDPMQEALPDEPVGSNSLSLNDARRNFARLGAVSEAKQAEVELDGKEKYPLS
jgi:hypothetical protein